MPSSAFSAGSFEYKAWEATQGEQLKTLCREAGVSSSGTKDALIERLMADDKGKKLLKAWVKTSGAEVEKPVKPSKSIKSSRSSKKSEPESEPEIDGKTSKAIRAMTPHIQGVVLDGANKLDPVRAMAMTTIIGCAAWLTTEQLIELSKQVHRTYDAYREAGELLN